MIHNVHKIILKFVEFFFLRQCTPFPPNAAIYHGTAATAAAFCRELSVVIYIDTVFRYLKKVAIFHVAVPSIANGQFLTKALRALLCCRSPYVSC